MENMLLMWNVDTNIRFAELVIQEYIRGYIRLIINFILFNQFYLI